MARVWLAAEGRQSDWHRASVSTESPAVLFDRLTETDQIDWPRATLDSASFPTTHTSMGGTSVGTEAVGPITTDLGKQGTKDHVETDGQRTPLAAVLSRANGHDCERLEPTADAIPQLYNGQLGRNRCQPDERHADNDYDFAFCRRARRPSLDYA